MAYSTLQPGMEYFDLEGIGYVAYMTKWGTRFVLGDPIASKENIREIVSRALRQHAKTAFYQVSESTAKLLNENFGFYANVFGTETVVERPGEIFRELSNLAQDHHVRADVNALELVKRKDELYSQMTADSTLRKDFWKIKRRLQKLNRKELPNEKQTPRQGFSERYLSGGKMEFIRRQFRAAVKSGVIVEEHNPSEWNVPILRDISNEWLETKVVSSSEMKLFTRPLSFELDAVVGARLFAAKTEGNLCGYAILDPLYQADRCIGYYADIIRMKKDAPKGTGYLLLVEAMRIIFEEGKELFHLGLSPFHKVDSVYWERVERQDNKIKTLIFNSIFEHANFLYNAKSQAFHKERFNASTITTYCCSRETMPLTEIVAGFLVSGVNPLKQVFLG